MEPIGCPEMSVRNYHYSLRNNPVERSFSSSSRREPEVTAIYEGWNFNSGNYLFTTDTK